MGEIIAVGIVVGAILVAVGFISAFKRTPHPTPPADTTDNLVRLTIKLPEDRVQTIVDDLRAVAAANKPGFVEFYENPNRLIRIIVSD